MFVIEIWNLYKFYGLFEVLKGVDICVEVGQVILLIGLFGLGKFMLLCCVNLFEDSQQGDILFKGEFVVWKGID